MTRLQTLRTMHTLNTEREKRVEPLFSVPQAGQPLIDIPTNLGFTLRGPAANDAMRLQYAPFSVDTPYEPIEVFLTLLATHDGGTYFDVGANLGYFSLVAACNRAAEAALVVHAFEPAPFYHGLLRHNISANRQGTTIRPHPCALTDRAGEQTLHLFDTNTSLDPNWSQEVRGQAALGTTSVRTSRLDDLFDPADLVPPFIFKIDVEGTELAVLLGGERLLRSPESAFVLVEAHRDSEEQHAVLRTLSAWGYTCLGLARYSAGEYFNIWNDRLIPLEAAEKDSSMWCSYWMCLRDGHPRAAAVTRDYGLYGLFASTRYLDVPALEGLLSSRVNDVNGT